MRKSLAVTLVVPFSVFPVDLIKFEANKPAVARDVNENFTRLDSAIQNRAVSASMESAILELKTTDAVLKDSVRVITDRIRRDSSALAQFQAKVRTDSVAVSTEVKSLQASVKAIGPAGLPTSAVSGKVNSIAKFTGVAAVGNSSLVDDGATVTTSANLFVAGGAIKMTNSISNVMEFASSGLGLPTLGARAKGARVVWFPGANTTTAGEYATGIDGYTLWTSLPLENTQHSFKWVAGDKSVMTVNGVGDMDLLGNLRLGGALSIDGDVNFSSKLSIAGGVLSFTGPSNYLDFGRTGINPPQDVVRSSGTKAVWYSQHGSNPGEVDYATGIDNGTLWNSIPLNSSLYSFKWFGGSTPIMTLDGSGNLSLAGVLDAKVVTRGIAASSVADYVFSPEYKLASLSEVEAYTKAHGHLSEVPSAKDVEKNGLDLAAMNMVLLKKVEELTLHAISQEKLLDSQKAELLAQRQRLDRLEAR